VPPRSTSSSNVGTAPDEIAGWPPRWLTPVPAEDVARGDGALLLDFGEAVCRVDKDSLAAQAGELLIFRPWQRQLFAYLLARRADLRYRHRQALIGVARKNGKSGKGASLGLGGLVLGPQGGEVYSCAADKQQAKVVFDTARRMVKMDPELSEILKVYRDVIEFTKTGSVYRALSAEAYTKEGLNPHMVIFDEVHAQPNRELWDVMSLAMGARVDPLMVGITTAGVRTDTTGQDSLCYTLYQYGCRIASGELVDPSFFMAWWEPFLREADHRAPATWREANPGLGDLVDIEDLATAVLKTPENEFRTKRCNQWVPTQQAWFPTGLWESLTHARPVPDGADVVLAFDGSFSGDSTGLTVHSVADLHIDVVECWANGPRRGRGCGAGCVRPLERPSLRVRPADLPADVRAARRRGLRRRGHAAGHRDDPGVPALLRSREGPQAEPLRRQAAGPPRRERGHQGHPAGLAGPEGNPEQPPEDRPRDLRGDGARVRLRPRPAVGTLGHVRMREVG
jgi:hypothetical protein